MLGAAETLRHWLVGRLKVNVKLVTRRKAQKNTSSTTAQNGTRSDGRSQRRGAKCQKFKKEWKWQGGIVAHPLSDFSVTKWKSEKHKSWNMPAEGSRATLQRTALSWVQLESGEHVVGQWCSWTAMKNWCPCMGCTAGWEAELEVQRTMKRAELTAFLCLLKKKSDWTHEVQVDNEGIIDGLWRGVRNCIDPKSWRC